MAIARTKKDMIAIPRGEYEDMKERNSGRLRKDEGVPDGLPKRRGKAQEEMKC